MRFFLALLFIILLIPSDSLSIDKVVILGGDDEYLSPKPNLSLVIVDLENPLNTVNSVYKHKNNGQEVALAIMPLLYKLINEKNVVSECQFYGGWTMVDAYHEIYPDWKERLIDFLNTDPILWDIDLLYVADEVNLGCIKIDELEEIISTLSLNYSAKTAIGYELQNSGLGFYLPSDLDVVVVWNYFTFDPFWDQHPLNNGPFNYSQNVMPVLGDREVILNISLSCHIWDHRKSKVPFSIDCDNDTARITEAFFNQYLWAKTRPEITAISIDSSTYDFPWTKGFNDMGPINRWMVQKILEEILGPSNGDMSNKTSPSPEPKLELLVVNTFGDRYNFLVSNASPESNIVIKYKDANEGKLDCDSTDFSTGQADIGGVYIDSIDIEDKIPVTQIQAFENGCDRKSNLILRSFP